MVQRIDIDIDNCNIGVKNKKEQCTKLEKDTVDLEKSIKEYEIEIEKIKEDVTNSNKNTEELKEERTKKSEKQTKVEEEILTEFNIIEDLKAQIVKIDVKKTKVEQDIEETINKMWEEYEITPNNALNFEKPINVQETTKRVNNLRTDIKNLGSVNIDSIEEYKQTSKRYDFMCEQRLDLENGVAKLKKVITDMTSIMKEQFEKQFEVINKNFDEVFRELFGGGKAELILTDTNNILECGIEIRSTTTRKETSKYDIAFRWRKGIYSNSIIICNTKNKPSTILRIR